MGGAELVLDAPWRGRPPMTGDSPIIGGPWGIGRRGAEPGGGITQGVGGWNGGPGCMKGGPIGGCPGKPWGGGLGGPCIQGAGGVIPRGLLLAVSSLVGRTVVPPAGFAEPGTDSPSSFIRDRYSLSILALSVTDALLGATDKSTRQSDAMCPPPPQRVQMTLEVTFVPVVHSQSLCPDNPQFRHLRMSNGLKVPLSSASCCSCNFFKSLSLPGTSIPLWIMWLILSTAFLTDSGVEPVMRA